MGDVRLRLLVDSGARITMIAHELFKKSWGDRTLFPPDRAPVSYEGRRIELEGYIEDVLEFKGRKIQGKIYVAVRRLNILGWYHQGLFGMVLKPGTSKQVLVVQDMAGSLSLEQEFPKVFSDTLGKMAGFKHKIRIKKDAVPVKHKVRSVPFSLRSDLKIELERLEKSGIIEPLESSLWLSPLVVARKRNGEIRLCIDLRRLNKEIWVDAHPLPKIGHSLEELREAQWFSKIDLAAAYHQIVLEAESRHYTAFNSPFGSFQFCRMPFGLASAASVFQRVMQSVLKDVKGVVIFQDDVLIFARHLEEHDKILKNMLSIFEEKGIVIKKK